MYFFWWNKPLDVNRPIVLEFREPTESDSSDRGVVAESEKSQRATGPSFWTVLVTKLKAMPRSAARLPTKTYRLIDSILGDEHIEANHERVPTFAALKLGDPFPLVRVGVIAGIIGVGFGAVHFAAWNLEVPTFTERILWRISTVAISGTFVVSSCFTFSAFLGDLDEWGWMLSIAIFFLYSLIPIIPLYLISRFLLFALAFASLRDLPPGAYREIEWTSYIPHFG